jgi:hypothetical protein
MSRDGSNAQNGSNMHTQEFKMLISVVDQIHNPRGRRALAARKWFELSSPPDAPPLPLGYNEREHLKVGGLKHLVAWYACSLACRDYAVNKHPSFYDYACGVMASEHAPYFIKEDEELQRRFPPWPLKGLGPGLVWEPPAIHARTMASWQRSQARLRAAA